MFVYYYRSFDKEMDKKIPVISVAMLTDDNPKFRKDVYEFKLFGFEIRMKIPIVKILDYKLKEELRQKLETSSNPMTMIVKAQLKSLEVKKADNDKKFEVTKELIRLCYQKGYSRKDIRVIMNFFSGFSDIGKLGCCQQFPFNGFMKCLNFSHGFWMLFSGL